MAGNINLDSLRDLGGFVGAALVDSDSGMALGTSGGGTLGLEVAAAGNTEVVRAKRRVAASLGLDDGIEDILITLGKAYHILRPVGTKQGLFFYVVLDRAKSNLALARRKVLDVESNLEM